MDSAIQRLNNQDQVVFAVCLIKELSSLIDENFLGPMSIPLITMWPVKASYAFAVVKTASNKNLYILLVEIKSRLILM